MCIKIISDFKDVLQRGTQMKIRELVTDYFNNISDSKKAEFDRKIVDTAYEIKGTTTKQIDDFAKSLVMINANFYEFPLDNYEEIVLAGCYIGYCNAPAKDKIEMLNKLLPYIDNWASCDVIIARLKWMESEREYFVDLIKSDKPFYNRFGIVWLMKYQLKSDYKRVIKLVNQVKNDNFYVKMAIAWCNAEAFVYDYEFMYNFLKKTSDTFIRNKTIQKVCESYRISPERKVELKKLKLSTSDKQTK